MEKLYKQIIDELSNSEESPIDLFKDAIEFLALKIMVNTDFKIEKENTDKYFKLSQKYSNKDLKINLIIKLICELISHFKEYFFDYLGELYMKVINEFGKPTKGQFFTPYNVSRMMATMLYKPINNNGKLITVNDPCCGSGGMCIAFIEMLDKKKINYLQDYLFYLNDNPLILLHNKLYLNSHNLTF